MNTICVFSKAGLRVARPSAGHATKAVRPVRAAGPSSFDAKRTANARKLRYIVTYANPSEGRQVTILGFVMRKKKHEFAGAK
jgi:hypothetical protein